MDNPSSDRYRGAVTSSDTTRRRIFASEVFDSQEPSELVGAVSQDEELPSPEVSRPLSFGSPSQDIFTPEPPLSSTSETGANGSVRRFQTSDLCPGTQTTHKEAIIAAVHETVVTEQIPVRDLNWTHIFRKVRRSFPGSFPRTTIETNGGRTCKICYNR